MSGEAPLCKVCGDTGIVMEDSGGTDPSGRFIEVPSDCPECSVCHCGMLMKDHSPWGSCTTPVVMRRDGAKQQA